ncbi:MobQ family relaxase [Nitrospira sp. T9]|uniref:MobQ family relaxase n=1 Tax=unclassified Nitrospira TaxID=2652172 RepID=UPI003F9ADAD6
MAIYHYSAKVIGRSTGRSVTAAAAYRAGVDIHDSTTGLDHKYSSRGGVIESEILTPDYAPDWATDRAALWNIVEATEKRKDAQLAREVEVSLPHELNHDQRRELLTSFAHDRYVSKGMIADISYHAPGQGGDDRNHHAHILLTLRPLNDHGAFGNKNRAWNQKQALVQDREAWADYLNQALERVGSQDRVDARSFEERGMGQKPTKHLGPDATEMERRGEPTRIGDENREAEYWNRELAELESQEKIIDLAIEREKRKIAHEQTRTTAFAQKARGETLREKTQGFPDQAALLAQRQERIRLKHLDERRALEAQIDRKRYELIESNERIYDQRQAQKDLKIAQNELRKAQTPFGRLSGREKVLRERVEALRLNLEDIERRQQERRGQFDRFAAEQLAALEHQQHLETERLHAPPLPDRDSDTKDFREYTPDAPAPRAVNDPEAFPDHDLDHDQGPELDR